MSSRGPPPLRISTNQPRPPTGPRGSSYANSPGSASAQPAGTTSTQKRTSAGLRDRSPPGQPKRARTGDTSGYSPRTSDAADERRSSTTSRSFDLQRRAGAVHSPVHAYSPGSGSGASTPVHGAPPVPSMLPQVGSALAGPGGNTDEAPINMASILQIQRRKKAIVDEVKSKGGASAPGVIVAARLQAQDRQITSLKQERDRMSEQLESLAKRLEQARPQFDAVALVQRIEKVEQSTQELVKSTKDWISTSQLEAKLGQIVTKEAHGKDLERLLNDTRVERQRTETRLKERIDAEAKVIKDLSTGFNILDKAQKDFNKQDLPGRLQDLTQNFQTLKENEAKTWNKVSDIDHDFQIYIGPVKKAFELNNNTTLVERLNKFGTLVGQVKNFQSGQAKLFNDQTKLTTDQDNLGKEQERLVNRIVALEKSKNTNNLGPGFKKVSTTVPSTSTSNGNGSTEAALQKLNKDIKSLQDCSSKLQHDVSSQTARIDVQTKAVNEQGEKLRAIESQNAQLGNQITRTEERISGLAKIEEGIRDLPQTLSQLDARLTKVEASGPVSGSPPGTNSDSAALASQIDELDNVLGSVEKASHEHGLRLDIVEKAVPALFSENFDPFKKSTTDHLASVNQTMTSLQGQVTGLATSLHNQVAGLATVLEKKVNEQLQRVKSPAQPASAAPDQKLRQDVTQLQAAVQSTHRDVGLLQQQSALKADKAAISQQMERFTHSVRYLQDQYNNITTDELHGRMVQWFLQNYPSNAATMLQDFAALREEVNVLKDHSAQIDWIKSRAADFSSALNNAPLVQELLNTVQEIRLPHVLEKINTAFNDGKQAITKAEAAEAKAEMHAKAISGIQQSMHNLNASSPAQMVQALEKRLRDLRKDVETGLNSARDDRVAAINELRTAAGNDHEHRVKEMKQLKERIISCTTSSDNLASRVTSIEETSGALRTDVDGIRTKFIEPNLKVFQGYANVLMCVAQLQYYVESLNQNMPYGPLPIDWRVDLNKTTGPDDLLNGKGKGNGKSKE